jgi:hypothetical protein
MLLGPAMRSGTDMSNQFVVALVLALTLAAGCDSAAPQATCSGSGVRACSCPGGGSGTQVRQCSPQGIAWGPCTGCGGTIEGGVVDAGARPLEAGTAGEPKPDLPLLSQHDRGSDLPADGTEPASKLDTAPTPCPAALLDATLNIGGSRTVSHAGWKVSVEVVDIGFLVGTKDPAVAWKIDGNLVRTKLGDSEKSKDGFVVTPLEIQNQGPAAQRWVRVCVTHP